MLSHRGLVVLILALACQGEPFDPGFPPPDNGQPPSPFPPGLGLRLGGTGADVIRAVRLDPSGNVVVTGTFTGITTLDQGGAAPLTSFGGTDAFLAKYAPNGTLLWARRFGGTQDELVTDLAIDAAGNLFVSGAFEGTAAFDPSGTAAVLTSAGGSDGFVARFNPDGTLAWAVRFGGAGLDEVSALAADGGSVYSAGAFTGQANAAPLPGPTIQSLGGRDGFVLALSTDGGVRWVIPVGGPQDDAALGIAPIPGGVAVAGVFRSTADFAQGAGGGTFLAALGGADVFLATYATSGAYLSTRGFGGLLDENLATGGLSADAGGNLILLGSFSGSVDFDPGPGVVARQSIGIVDLFVSRFDPSGQLTSALTLGGTGVITGARAIPAADGGALVTGSFSGPIDFDPGSGVTVLTSLGLQGVTDAFVARFSPAGALAWVNRFGEATALAGRGAGGTGLAVDASGRIIAAGFFAGTIDIDPGATSSLLASLGQADGFVVRLTPEGALAP